MLESKFQDECIKLIKKRGHYVFKKQQYGNEPGIPDLICCVKGFFLGVEVKRPDGKGKVSEQQVIQMEKIIKCGGFAIVVDNLKNLEEYLTYMEGIQ